MIIHVNEIQYDISTYIYGVYWSCDLIKSISPDKMPHVGQASLEIIEICLSLLWSAVIKGIYYMIGLLVFFFAYYFSSYTLYFYKIFNEIFWAAMWM